MTPGARQQHEAGDAGPPTVVVVLHASGAELRGLLASLDRHLPERQLVVVDTAPGADDGAELAAAHGAEVVLLPENPGFGPANNAGVRLARNPVTLLLNPDTVLLDGGVQRLSDAAAAHDALHVPSLRNPDGNRQRSAHPAPGRAWELIPAVLPPRALPAQMRRAAEPWRTEGGPPRRVGWAIAAVLAARTSTLRTLGPFDPAAFLHFEDLDLCLRAERRGVPTVLHPGVAVQHLGGHSTGRDPRRIEAEATRRRAVVRDRLGARALLLDDAAQGLTFVTRGARPGAAGARARAQLHALRDARRGR